MNVLITGAAGFMGAFLAKHAMNTSTRVWGLGLQHGQRVAGR